MENDQGSEISGMGLGSSTGTWTIALCQSLVFLHCVVWTAFTIFASALLKNSLSDIGEHERDTEREGERGRRGERERERRGREEERKKKCLWN